MAHVNELMDFVVSAFVTCRKRVLLLRHAALDAWLPPGGHIELGEVPDEALARELREETGLLLGVDTFPLPARTLLDDEMARRVPAGSSHNRAGQLRPIAVDVHDFPPKPGHRHVALVYALGTWREDVRIEEGKAKELKWHSQEELPADLMPAIRVYCEYALKFPAPRRPRT